MATSEDNAFTSATKDARIKGLIDVKTALASGRITTKYFSEVAPATEADSQLMRTLKLAAKRDTKHLTSSATHWKKFQISQAVVHVHNGGKAIVLSNPE